VVRGHGPLEPFAGVGLESANSSLAQPLLIRRRGMICGELGRTIYPAVPRLPAEVRALRVPGTSSRRLTTMPAKPAVQRSVKY
jgi:hypothetical protein